MYIFISQCWQIKNNGEKANDLCTVVILSCHFLNAQNFKCSMFSSSSSSLAFSVITFPHAMTHCPQFELFKNASIVKMFLFPCKVCPKDGDQTSQSFLVGFLSERNTSEVVCSNFIFLPASRQTIALFKKKKKPGQNSFKIPVKMPTT